MFYSIKNSLSLLVLMQRAWQAVAGVVTLVLVAYYLTPIEQGYFYTFSSIAAMHMALDMGLSAILLQFGAREFIGLSWELGGEISGTNRYRFLALIRLSLRWYGIAAIVFLLAYPVGLQFIARSQVELAYDWRNVWAVLVCVTAVNLLYLPVFALAEGGGCISEVYTVRLIQGVVGAIAAWFGLLMGWGLYVVIVTPTANAVVAAVWLYFWRSGMLAQSYRQSAAVFNWRLEIWPLQWRSGASWFAGYALVLMHVPLLFHTQGPVVAGQMGVTMTVANMLSILAFSWMTTSIPSMTRAVVLKDWIELDLIFWTAFRKSTAAYIVVAVVLTVMRGFLESTHYGDRFLPFFETVGLLLAISFYHITGLFSAYLRSHLQEPFLFPSLVGALMTSIGAILIAPEWGAAGVIIVLLLVNALFFLPAAIWMWVYYRKKWHEGH